MRKFKPYKMIPRGISRIGAKSTPGISLGKSVVLVIAIRKAMPKTIDKTSGSMKPIKGIAGKPNLLVLVTKKAETPKAQATAIPGELSLATGQMSDHRQPESSPKNTSFRVTNVPS